MGACISFGDSYGAHHRNHHVAEHSSYENPAPHLCDEGQVRMICVWNDYTCTPPPWSRLDTKFAGEAMRALAASCNIKDYTELSNTQATAAAVSAAIKQVGSRCHDHDYFVFYYTGHGDRMLDDDADEESGFDNSFCLVDAMGNCNHTTYMRDDDFADLITSSVPPKCRVLVLSDSCHSGSICDLGKWQWAEREAVSITGCQDHQVSAGTGKGGVFTLSMLNVIHEVQDEHTDAPIGLMYNMILTHSKVVFQGQQDITLQCSASATPTSMPWPLAPVQHFGKCKQFVQA